MLRRAFYQVLHPPTPNYLLSPKKVGAVHELPLPFFWISDRDIAVTQILVEQSRHEDYQ